MVVDEINLAANKGLDARLSCGLIKIHRAKEVAMVGHRQRRHIELSAALHITGGIGTAVEEGVMRVGVQVYKWFFGHRKRVV